MNKDKIKLYQGHGEYDPTRSTALRNMFASKLRGRLKKLRSVIKESIIDKDCFGLAPTNQQEMEKTSSREFDYSLDHEKVSAFIEWLKEQMASGVIDMSDIGNSPESAWTSTYILEAYKRGVQRARMELRKAKYDVPDMESTGGIESALQIPNHRNRLQSMYHRVLSEMESLVNDFAKQVGRILYDSFSKGHSPSEIYDRIKGLIDGKKRKELGLTLLLGSFVDFNRRVDMIGRTEIVRTINEAAITEYEHWEVEQLGIMAEWVTAGDRRVCQYCRSMSQKGPYNLSESRGLLPAHSLCRCFWLPVEVES
ncbi:MAG: hypothetical protein ACLFT4_01315 [Bacteroidales bacterium]